MTHLLTRLRLLALAALVALVALVAGLAPAQAQTFTVPVCQAGFPCYDIVEGFKPTFSSSAVGLATAASATDVFCISPGASRTIRVGRVQVSGTGTLNTLDVSLVMRSTLDTGGTAASTTANPANNVVAHDPVVDGTTSATLISYTANPTAGNLAGILRTQKLVANIAAQSTGTGEAYLIWDLGTHNGKMPVLRKSSTYQLCVNLNGQTLASPSVDIDIEWTEEP